MQSAIGFVINFVVFVMFVMNEVPCNEHQYNVNCADIGEELVDVWPLDGVRIRRLTVNGVQLLDHLDPDAAFITELATAGCITWPQREYILSLMWLRDRNDKLLEFLTRRSVADFENFTRVLAKYQLHLVKLLVTDGGLYFLQMLCTAALIIAVA